MRISYAEEDTTATTDAGGTGASQATMALRYLGLLVVTFASAIAISGLAPADVVAAAGL